MKKTGKGTGKNGRSKTVKTVRRSSAAVVERPRPSKPGAMKLAMVGLGRMGGNMVQRLLRGGHEVVAYDRSAELVKTHVGFGAESARGLSDVCRKLEAPRVVWIMVPSGAPVEATINELIPQLQPGDIIIDGGNSNFHDTMRRAEKLKTHGIEYIDSGTSGGIW